MHRVTEVNPRRLFCAAIFLVVALGTSAQPGHGVSRRWINPSGGQASTPSNWSPSGVPGPGDALTFDLSNTYTVTYDGAVPTDAQQTYRAGTVTLSISGTHATGSDVYVGTNGSSSVSLTDGTWIAEGGYGLEIGRNPGDSGTLTVRSRDAVLQVMAGNFAGMTVGKASATGTLSIIDAGFVNVPWLDVASGTSSTGHVTVTGGAIAPLQHSTLYASGTMKIGVDGSATLDVENGAIAEGQNVRIGLTATGSGTVTVQGNYGTYPATLSARNELDVYSGSLTIGDGGAVEVATILRVGTYFGSALLHVREGGLLTLQDSTFEDDATLLFDGGIIHCDGVFNPPGSTLTLDSQAGTPTLEMSGSLHLQELVSPYRALEIGSSGNGSLHVLGSGVCIIEIGHVSLGRNSTGDGNVAVDSGAELSVPSSYDLNIGMGGHGTVTVGSTGRITAGSVYLGRNSTGVGALTVTGAGAILTAQNGLYVGGTSSSAQGTGTVTIGSSALVEVLATGVTTRIWYGGGTLNVHFGGRLTSAGTITHQGQINLAGGTIEAPHLDATLSAVIDGWGTVDASINGGSSTTILANGGNLTLGSAADVLGFVNMGTLSVGNEVVTLHDADAAALGNVQIAAGYLVLPNGGSLATGKTLSGFGLIDGALANSGTISSTGSGLQFDGILSGVGQGVSGSGVLAFLDEGGYTGAGTLDAPIRADAGSVITATGALTIGRSLSNGVVLNGNLLVGASMVTLLDSDGISLGALTSIDGGHLSYTGTLDLAAERTVNGSGNITSPLLRNGGVLSPGLGDAGAFTHYGAYTQLDGGAYVVQLGDHASHEWDLIRNTDAASLAGGLSVSALPSFRPQVGDVYRVMTFTSRAGTFRDVRFQEFGPGVTFDVVYGATYVDLVVAADGVSGVQDEAGAERLPFRFYGLAAGGDAAFVLSLPEEAFVRLDVFDLGGRRIAQLHEGPLLCGQTTFVVPRSELAAASGVYFGRLDVSGAQFSARRTARVTVVR